MLAFPYNHQRRENGCMVRRLSSEQRADRRVAYLDAVVAVVRREGRAVSMEAMAREAGVTKPILYRMFGDRNGLLMAVGERFADEIAETLAVALAPASAGHIDPSDALRAGIDAYLALVERDPELYRFITERLAADPSQPIATFIDGIARNITLVLNDQLRAGGADTGSAEAWAYAVVGMVHTVGDWWINRPTMRRDALVDTLVALLWDGFGGVVESTGETPKAAESKLL